MFCQLLSWLAPASLGSLAGDSCPLAHGREEVGMGVVVGKLEHLANRGVLSPGQIQD